MPPAPENVTRMTRRTAYNTATGEVLELVEHAPRGRRKRKGKRRMFALMDLDSLAMLELTGNEWAVLHLIMRAVNAETNEARVTQTEIGEGAGIAAPNVSRTIKALRERRIIHAPRPGVYVVNAHIMYRGAATDWETATEVEPEPRWRRP